MIYQPDFRRRGVASRIIFVLLVGDNKGWVHQVLVLLIWVTQVIGLYYFFNRLGTVLTGCYAIVKKATAPMRRRGDVMRNFLDNFA